MRNLLIQALQCTEHQLDMLVFDHYFLWCELNSYSDGDLQRIMANKQIEQWFQLEYKKCQAHFLKISKPYAKLATKEEMEKLYNKEVSKIREYYPTTLIRSVRHKKYSIHGIPENPAKN